MVPEAHSQVVRPEQAPQGSTPDRIHSPRLKVDKYRSGHILPSGRLIVVHVDALELHVGRALVGTIGLDAVFLGDDLPGVVNAGFEWEGRGDGTGETRKREVGSLEW